MSDVALERNRLSSRGVSAAGQRSRERRRAGECGGAPYPSA
jgi:hypothetical protein